MERTKLYDDYEISPVIKGGWQLSTGHTIDKDVSGEQAVEDMIKFIESGITTLDFGDIYTGVEELVGRALSALREIYGDQARKMIQLHTKYVPNNADLENLNPNDAETILRRSCERLGVEQVDLVQFHWWRYEAKGYLPAIERLFELKEKGLVGAVGITNFDSERVQEMIEAGLTPQSIQLQYSLLDRRPEKRLFQLCKDNDISVFCYGTVAGGYLSNRYLGQEEPAAETRSNVKYRLIIEEFGGWTLYQELLQTLNIVAQKYGTDIATIASAYALHNEAVNAVIVGARNLNHLDSNLEIPEIQFDTEDLMAIEKVLAHSKGPSGPVYDLERNSAKHSGIMHTNNN
ncbi:MAG: aryl-alcohol dehydrogenase-like predicted oxidoreductase [Oceanicoccus sp.]|jgi:aryl-alcohol dehydrogenase-like predicted oxidoreductase